MSLVGEVIEFTTQSNTQGFGSIVDKILSCSTNSNGSFTSYIVKDLKGKIHIVTPSNITRVIAEEGPDKQTEQVEKTGDIFDSYLESMGHNKQNLSAKERALQKNQKDREEPDDLPF